MHLLGCAIELIAAYVDSNMGCLPVTTSCIMLFAGYVFCFEHVACTPELF